MCKKHKFKISLYKFVPNEGWFKHLKCRRCSVTKDTKLTEKEFERSINGDNNNSHSR